MKRIGIARIGLVAAGLTAAVTTDAQAQQDGMLMKNLLSGLGVIQDDREPIDYRERPPLVLPPRMDLREPVASGSAQARNGQWPNDPDVAARKRREAEEQAPSSEHDGNRMLSINEMRAGRRAGAELATAPVARSEKSHWVNPDVLREQGRQVRATNQVAEDDGTRRTLTEPPSAYRKSATGAPIKGSFTVTEKVDESDPKVFLRNQQQRNR